jgi:hypothetical protein
LLGEYNLTMKKLALIFAFFLATVFSFAYTSKCFARDLQNQVSSPDGRYIITSKTLTENDVFFLTSPLYLKDQKTGKLISVNLDYNDESTYVTFDWSRDSKCFAVNYRTGSNSSFYQIFAIRNNNVINITDRVNFGKGSRPMAENYDYMHSYQVFIKWLDGNLYLASDYMYNPEKPGLIDVINRKYTCKILNKNKLGS